MLYTNCGWCNKYLSKPIHPLSKFCSVECKKNFRRKYSREYTRKNYSKYKKKGSITSKLWRARHPDYMKEWLKSHPQYHNNWRKRNCDRIREYFRSYLQKLKEKNPYYFKKYKNRYWVYAGITLSQYDKLTKKCAIKDCGFSTTVDLHHRDKNKDNNEISNLIGLCPSHHQLIHRLRYKLKPENNSWLLIKPK